MNQFPPSHATQQIIAKKIKKSLPQVILGIRECFSCKYQAKKKTSNLKSEAKSILIFPQHVFSAY